MKTKDILRHLADYELLCRRIEHKRQELNLLMQKKRKRFLVPWEMKRLSQLVIYMDLKNKWGAWMTTSQFMTIWKTCFRSTVVYINRLKRLGFIEVKMNNDGDARRHLYRLKEEINEDHNIEL